MTAAQLKASILDQAVRGKLVPQDSNDEPAEKLLERIWEGRALSRPKDQNGRERSASARQGMTPAAPRSDVPAALTQRTQRAQRGAKSLCAFVGVQNEGWLCGTGSFFITLALGIDPSYAVLLFNTEYAKSYLIGNSVGSTMFNLNHSILMKMLIPLPPLAEQKRIVAKVEELLSDVERLKKGAA